MGAGASSTDMKQLNIIKLEYDNKIKQLETINESSAKEIEVYKIKNKELEIKINELQDLHDVLSDKYDSLDIRTECNILGLESDKLDLQKEVNEKNEKFNNIQLIHNKELENMKSIILTLEESLACSDIDCIKNMHEVTVKELHEVIQTLKDNHKIEIQKIQSDK